PLSSPPRLNDDHPSRIHPVVPGQELPPYPPLHRRKLLWQRDRPPHQHVSEVRPKHLLIFPSPPPIEIVTCIQPSPPRPLRVAKHLERILEVMIPQIDLVNVDPSRPRDPSTRRHVRLDLLDMLEH